MAVYKCKMCGGDLEPANGNNVVECEYCGTKQTVANDDSEKKINLFNRANRLRINSEFDKAGAIYEQLIAEFPEEAEAYWCLCLCNFGIEYVDDPLTGNKIPTVHRASFEKLRKDENYELALENADMSARIVYQEQAKEIDRIMGEILSISQNEKPYDIFICYKETDNIGRRTPDSVIAQEIYDALTAKGYKVFFSRITLEDKLGQQYEPYIFAALNSAKVMLAIGTDYEYYNAVWVKNEWSRFLKLMAKDKSKILIPCFKDMDAYDMPDEFKGLQAQDMGKLGFIQDLIRGIDKLTGRQEQPVTVNTAEKNPGIKEIAIEDGGLYTGEAVANKPHGKGKCIYPDGRSYAGDWAFGKYNGQGTLTYANGDKYEGEFKDSKMHGQGTLTYADHNQYVGEFKDGKRNGQGTLTYQDGEKLSGEWKDDEIWEGFGKEIYRDDDDDAEDIYIGEFKEGNRNGHGTYTFASGDKYEGEWKDDKRNGQGTFTYTEGETWSGEWRDGNIWTGFGKVLLSSDDKNLGYYSGEHKNGEINGQGMIVFANGNKYEGEWKDGKYHGQGTYTFADGKSWSGEWRNAQPHNGKGYWKGKKTRFVMGKKINSIV